MYNSSFHILQPSNCGTITEQADNLALQFDLLTESGCCRKEALLQARLYMSDAANQCDAIRHSRLYETLHPTGAFSYIEQPPLGGEKIALLLWFVGGDVKKRKVEFLPNGQILEISCDGISYMMQNVRFHEEMEKATAGGQMSLAFDEHLRQLHKRDMTLRDNCLRTWIYVRDVDRHYADVVRARNEVFDREGLTADTHYIASTGIGGASESRQALVATDFFSVKGLAEGQVGYLHALDYLNPTHEYGVAFERGTYADFPCGRHFFISGTASIDKYGKCLHRGDVLTQTGRLFLNIEKLLESAGGNLSQVRYFIVYLRDVADYRAVEAYMRLRFPKTPFLITEARVCRPEWLIEVECVAN